MTKWKRPGHAKTKSWLPIKWHLQLQSQATQASWFVVWRVLFCPITGMCIHYCLKLTYARLDIQPITAFDIQRCQQHRLRFLPNGCYQTSTAALYARHCLSWVPTLPQGPLVQHCVSCVQLAQQMTPGESSIHTVEHRETKLHASLDQARLHSSPLVRCQPLFNERDCQSMVLQRLRGYAAHEIPSTQTLSTVLQGRAAHKVQIHCSARLCISQNRKTLNLLFCRVCRVMQLTKP